MATKWWGWGEEQRTFPLPHGEQFWAHVSSWLGELGVGQRIESLAEVALPPSRLESKALDALRAASGADSLSTDSVDRAVHSLGKSYCDLVRIRRGEIPHATDAVVYPETEEQVAALLNAAAERGIAVIPFGGGTSVLGGVEPLGSKPTVTLDLQRMNRLLQLDPLAATATLEAGVLGPSLEQQLNANGFTLGHFPQSFEYSSLGGWIATRSAGQNSTLYGKIEHRVESLRMAFPGGTIATPAVPAAAAGPDLNQMIAGSEGVLGVITQATVRLAPLPKRCDYRGYVFPSFQAGVEASRELMQSGLTPSVLRLSDETETEVSLAMRPPPRALMAAAEGLYLALRRISFEGTALMIVGFDGDEDQVRSDWRRAHRILRRHEGSSLGRRPGRAWERARFEHPYLRDLLLDHAIMVDTLETAVTWDRYLALYGSVRDAMAKAMDGRGLVMAHLSHAYSDGASLYYTFLARQAAGQEMEQWQQVKVAATDAIIAAGGALSHHHGIGSDHQPWMSRYLGPAGVRTLAALKQTFDPHGLMNPGKLMPTSEDDSDVSDV
ncbi:MAG: FAD-binding oxidoreductase [Dehalococcoidia bacterium]|nr:MAG: FAD-binding oxidoreductase [Dehalococcoidia bacterium]